MRVMFSQNFIPSQRLSPNFQGKLKNDSKAQVSKGTQSPIQNNASSLDNVKTGQSTGVIGDAIAQAYLSRVGAFIGYAESFHLALKRVCDELKDEGFVYDEAYNSKHPIKSFASFMDKYGRQGYVQDTVRGTVYWPDQTNIASFKKFLDAMRKEGYEMAIVRVFNEQTGKLEKMPDLEIRQKGVTKEDLAPLGEFLQKAEISKPRSSTYADYQMRFVPINKRGKNEDKQTLELIMLYGPHYAKAKELESKYVYSVARSFDRLHIDLKQKYEEKTPGRRISNNIDVIKTRLREDVSKPLFVNAYNADLKIRGEEKLPVVISKAHSKMLDGYMSGIRQKIPMYYKEMRQKFKSDEYIANLIKQSNSRAENKTVSAQEIAERRKFYLERLKLMEAEDIATIAKSQEMLKETIERFGEK